VGWHDDSVLSGFAKPRQASTATPSTRRSSTTPPATRSYHYTIDGGLPVADNQGRFAVQPTPHGATMMWESSFRALDPAAEAKSAGCRRGMLPVMLGNLKTLIEHS
jgi:hypothetical protein